MRRIALLFLAAGCAGAATVQEAPAALPTVSVTAETPPPPPPNDNVGQIQTTASGLEYIDDRVGNGPSPASVTSTVTVHYTGLLPDGTKFDSSYDRGTPFKASLQAVIKGWQEGVLTMKVGGKRRLIIPPDLAYGASRIGNIPANATLTFDVELLAVDDVP